VQPAGATSAPPPRATAGMDPGPAPIPPGPELDELLATPAPAEEAPSAAPAAGDEDRAAPPAPAPSRRATWASAAAARANGQAAPPAEPAPAPPLADPSDDEAFVPEVVARARARHCATATGRVRAKTIAGNHLTRVERRAAGLVVYPDDVDRPRTRGDCASMPRPCPFVSCANHLYLDVNEESGAIKLNFPHLEVWQMAETCSLDVADRGGTTLEEVGALTNVTRERVRQIETRAVSRLRHAAPELAQEDAIPDTIRSVEDRLAWL